MGHNPGFKKSRTLLTDLPGPLSYLYCPLPLSTSTGSMTTATEKMGVLPKALVHITYIPCCINGTACPK